MRAVEDLQTRTLCFLSSDFARLVFLASTRDYNTGAYCHVGLEDRYTKPVAEMALETCHEEIFERVSNYRLEKLVRELATYLKTTNEDPATVLETWTTFVPYQLLPPRACKGVAKDYFVANIKIALAILQAVPTLYRC
jgi:hypothetical protein